MSKRNTSKMVTIKKQYTHTLASPFIIFVSDFFFLPVVSTLAVYNGVTPTGL